MSTSEHIDIGGYHATLHDLPLPIEGGKGYDKKDVYLPIPCSR